MTRHADHRRSGPRDVAKGAAMVLAVILAVMVLALGVLLRIAPDEPGVSVVSSSPSASPTEVASAPVGSVAPSRSPTPTPTATPVRDDSWVAFVLHEHETFASLYGFFFELRALGDDQSEEFHRLVNQVIAWGLTEQQWLADHAPSSCYAGVHRRAQDIAGTTYGTFQDIKDAFIPPFDQGILLRVGAQVANLRDSLTAFYTRVAVLDCPGSAPGSALPTNCEPAPPNVTFQADIDGDARPDRISFALCGTDSESALPLLFGPVVSLTTTTTTIVPPLLRPPDDYGYPDTVLVLRNGKEPIFAVAKRSDGSHALMSVAVYAVSLERQRTILTWTGGEWDACFDPRPLVDRSGERLGFLVPDVVVGSYGGSEADRCDAGRSDWLENSWDVASLPSFGAEWSDPRVMRVPAP